MPSTCALSNNAWRTGDFESIAHCVFSGLEDSDFHKAKTEHRGDDDLVVYEFAGGRASACVAVRSLSQIAYPSYRGSLKIKGFPLDRAELPVDFGEVQIGTEQYLMPSTEYWFGCYRNTYACFLNRVDFRNHRRFSSDSVVRFSAEH
jgi:hypothetical protein